MCMRTSAALAGRLQDSFVAMLPRIVATARRRFRDLDEATRQDAVSETIGIVWSWCRRLQERGKAFDQFTSVIIEMAIRHVMCGRRVATDESARDAMSITAQRRHGFRTSRLGDLSEAVEDSVKSSPPDAAAFRVDFGEFLSSLDDRRQKIIRLMAKREPTSALARQFNVSPGRISQLRREFEQQWEQYQEGAVAA